MISKYQVKRRMLPTNLLQPTIDVGGDYIPQASTGNIRWQNLPLIRQ